MRDRGIVLDPYLDHGVLVRVCAEVGVPVEELDPSSAGVAQVSTVGAPPNCPEELDICYCREHCTASSIPVSIYA